jgi:hypothetical protein
VNHKLYGGYLLFNYGHAAGAAHLKTHVGVGVQNGERTDKIEYGDKRGNEGNWGTRGIYCVTHSYSVPLVDLRDN